MEYSVKNIGKQYEGMSLRRKDKNPFSAKGFFDFANENFQKYGLIRCGEDLLVSTWFSSDLITDYRATLNN